MFLGSRHILHRELATDGVPPSRCRRPISRSRFPSLIHREPQFTESTYNVYHQLLVYNPPALAALSPIPEYRLLIEFRRLFEGRIYRHRSSTQGDFVAMHLYEDLCAIDRSPKLIAAIRGKRSVLNAQNRTRGIRARRGDGTFGEIIPGERTIVDAGFVVARGPIATVEIGVEVKILSKAMIKQIDRVTGDLLKQITHFKRGHGNPICVAIVGVNQAKHTVGYEGDRATATTGRGGFQHPIQEAAEAERRLYADAGPGFDEFLVLRYRATNEDPFSFEWVDYNGTRQDYGAALARISKEYQKRF
jgi:hypothetical protein